MKAVTKASIAMNFVSKQCKTCHFDAFCIQNGLHGKGAGVNRELVKQRIMLKSRGFLYDTRESLRYFYVVNSGALKAYISERDGRQKIINFYLPGEILGFEAIAEKAYSFSVEAIAETSVCVIPYDYLLQLIAFYPELQKQILYLMSQRIGMGACVTHYRAEDRFIGFLIEMAKRLHCESDADKVEFNLPITRRDIADYLGLAPETISRLICRLQQEELIFVDNKLIKIPSVNRLRSYF